MPEAQFLVGGPNISSVGRRAERQHQSFVGVIECSQSIFPQLAGKRLFLVKYGDIDNQDVEMIRQELARGLDTQAWSITKDAAGNLKFFPERTGADVIPRNRREEYESHVPPRRREPPRDPYHDEYDEDDEDSDGDWDWDYPASSAYPGRRGNSYASEDDAGNTPWDDPEPARFRDHRRNTFGDEDGHGGRPRDDPDPRHFRDRRRNTFDDDYDGGHMRRDGPQPHPYSSRGRNSHSSSHGRGNNTPREQPPTSRAAPPPRRMPPPQMPAPRMPPPHMPRHPTSPLRTPLTDPLIIPLFPSSSSSHISEYNRMAATIDPNSDLAIHGMRRIDPVEYPEWGRFFEPKRRKGRGRVGRIVGAFLGLRG